jgi:RNA polymerase sigma factor (sigma-70 family)
MTAIDESPNRTFSRKKLNPNPLAAVVSLVDRTLDGLRVEHLPGGTTRMLMLETGATDRQLLDHFVHDQDSRAFQSLVVRHGTAVHRVCHAVLKDPHEAEDAFQATFLVLARRAPDIQDPETLRAWLRGVAYRIAVRARRRVARRRENERTLAEMSWAEPVAAPVEATLELRELVEDELNRLPDDYRQAIVLCYLDGLTHQEAARRLNWPVGTVKVRLVRGRRMLRERLNRRGIALGAALLLMLSASRRADGVTMPLVESTVRAMSLEAAGRWAALNSEYPRALELARSFLGFGLVRGSPWLWAATAVVGALLLFSVPVARAFSGPPSPEVDASALPSNLTDVLNVECR